MPIISIRSSRIYSTRKGCCIIQKKSPLSAKQKRRQRRKAYIRKRLDELNSYHPKPHKERPCRSDVLRRLPMIELLLNLFLILFSWGLLLWWNLHVDRYINKNNLPNILKEFRGIAYFTSILIMIVLILVFTMGKMGCILSLYGMRKQVWKFYRSWIVVNMVLVGCTVCSSIVQHIRPKSNWSTNYLEKHGIGDFGEECSKGSNDTQAFVQCHDEIQKYYGPEKHGFVQMTLINFIISVFLLPILSYLSELQGFVDTYHPLLFYYTTREKYRFQGINEPEILYRYIRTIPPNLRTNFEKQVLYWLRESFKTRQRLEKYGIRKPSKENDEKKLNLKGRDRIPARSISTRKEYDPKDSEGSGYNTPSPSEQKVIHKWSGLYDITYHNKEQEEVTSYSLIMFRGIDDAERCALDFEIRKSDPDVSSTSSNVGTGDEK